MQHSVRNPLPPPIGAVPTTELLSKNVSASVGRKSGVVVLPSLPLQTESAITQWLYKAADASLEAAHNSGLLSPLWLWTHVCYTDAQRAERSAVKASNLIVWLLRNRRAESQHIAVVSPHSDMLKKVQQELNQCTAAMHHTISRTGTATPSDVAFLLTQEVPAAQRRRATAKATAPEAPDSLGLDAARHGAHATYHHVIVVLPEVPSDTNLSTMIAQEHFLCSNLAAATISFTIIADASWLAPHVLAAWKGWRGFVDKLALQSIRHAHVTILGCDETGALPHPPASPAAAPSSFKGSGLIGPRLPICCGIHHGQYLFFSGLLLDALGPVQHGGASFCKQLCMKPHHCFKPEHLCSAPCHPSHDHRTCTFACRALLPCGHHCMMECGEPCNCLEIVRERLPCSHQVVVGLDTVTQQPRYANVPHTFHGFCVSKGLPCVVDVPTICATCLGPFTAPCHQLQRMEHTMDNRTVSCDSCKRIEANIRSTALAEVLVRNEQQKRDMKADLAKSVHEQRKGAASGVFKIGARIVIRDATNAIPPFDPLADFPNVPFVDYDAENFYATLNGSMGIIVSQHVDVDDPTELRSLVRLSNGKCVLVGDGGMEFIRADVSGITGASNGSTPHLLLLAAPAAAPADGTSDEEKKAKDDAAAKFAAQCQAMVGKKFVLMNTVRVPLPLSQVEPKQWNAERKNGLGPAHSEAAEEAVESSSTSSDGDADNNTLSLSEVVVTVVGEDPQHRAHSVEVECVLFDRSKEQQALEDSLVLDVTTPGKKRPRDDGSTDAPSVPEGMRLSPHDEDQQGRSIIRFSVQAHDLDPLPFDDGGDVFVTHPQYQITSRELVDVLKSALRCTLASVPPQLDVCLFANAIAHDEVWRVEAVINAPIFNESDLQHGYAQVCRGPVCLLGSTGATNVTPHTSFRASSRRNGPHCIGGAPARSTAAQPSRKFVLVPLAFVAADEVTNAMNRMDDEAQGRFVELVRQRLQEQFEARALRNDELAYQAQLRMPPLTEEEGQLHHNMDDCTATISCPDTLPSKEELKRMDIRGKQLPVGVAYKLLEVRDSGNRKLAELRSKQFPQQLFVATKEEQEAIQRYLATVGTQLRHYK